MLWCICGPVILLGSLIGVLVMSGGYGPIPIYTSSDYAVLTCPVSGYSDEMIDCYTPCNCRYEGSGWRRHWVCDNCPSKCTLNFVVYSVNEIPGRTFKLLVQRYYMWYIKELYPIGSTTLCVKHGNDVLYGESVQRTYDCFVAGWVFLGFAMIACVILLVFYAAPFVVNLYRRIFQRSTPCITETTPCKPCTDCVPLE